MTFEIRRQNNDAQIADKKWGSERWQWSIFGQTAIKN